MLLHYLCIKLIGIELQMHDGTNVWYFAQVLQFRVGQILYSSSWDFH